MTMYTIEWTWRIYGDESRHDAALEAYKLAIAAGASHGAAEVAASRVLFPNSDSPPDNWSIAPIEATRALRAAIAKTEGRK